MKQRKIEHKNIILALALTSLVFVLGILLGDMFVSEKYDTLSEMNYNIQLETASMELQFELIKDEPCKIEDLAYLQEKVQLLGDRLTYLENIYGKNSDEIASLKNQYSQIQIRHWLLSKHLQEECSKDDDIILYFYSNKDCSKCDEQGTILTAFKESSIDNVKIYSFDLGIDDILVQTLVEIYNITTVPSIVFNNELYSGFNTLGNLQAR